MTDDALIAGAAAPTRRRWITSVTRLDVVWVVAVSAALVVSSRFDLIDLPNARLRTGDAPLRGFVVAIPILACVLSVVSLWRNSVVMAAAATGVLGPGLALAGSLSLSLFLDEASAFADVGVAVSLGAAMLGVAMLVRWFVYHPLPLLGDEARPRPAASLGLAVVGAAVAVFVVVTGLGDGVSSAWIGETIAMLVVPLLVLAGGVVRSVPAVVLAAAAAAAQVAAVLAVKAEQSSIQWDSDLVLRTGLPGLVGLTLVVVLAVVAVAGSRLDDTQIVIDDDESWRWSADD